MNAVGPISVPMDLLEQMVAACPTFADSLQAGVTASDRIHWLSNENFFDDRLPRPFAVIGNKIRWVRDGISDLYELRAQGDLRLVLSKDSEYPECMKDSAKAFLNWAGNIMAEIAEQSGHDSTSALPIVHMEFDSQPMRTLSEDRDTDGRFDFWTIEYVLRYGF